MKNNHFVARFHDLLCKEHQAVTGRELTTFFDTKAMEEGEHWETRFEHNSGKLQRLDNIFDSPREKEWSGRKRMRVTSQVDGE